MIMMMMIIIIIIIIIVIVSTVGIKASCTKCRHGIENCYNCHLSFPVLVSSIITHHSVSPIVKVSCPHVLCGVHYVLCVLELETWDWHCFSCCVCLCVCVCVCMYVVR